MIDFTVDDTEGGAVLTLSGDITIQRAAQLKDALVNAVEKVKHLTLNLEAVTAMDLTALQLLCAMHRSLTGSGKTLAVAGVVPAAVRQVVTDSGYVGCGGVEDESELWKGV